MSVFLVKCSPAKGGIEMAIQEIEATNLTSDIEIDRAKDAVVIESVSKIFKKHRSFLSWRKREEKAEKREVRAVDNVTMRIKHREIVGILGANGSGKSTLIRI